MCAGGLTQVAQEKATAATDRAVKDVSARRELEDLRAALRHAWKSRKLSVEIPVVLPPKSTPRDRWLTESEARKTASWRARVHPRAIQRRHHQGRAVDHLAARAGG